VEAIAGHKVAFEPNAIPAVVFTDPEIAWAGLTETQAKEQGREITVAKFPWAASGAPSRSTGRRPDQAADRSEDGARARRRNRGRGCGRTDCRRGAGDEMCALAADVGMTIHPHPTLSETMMEAAEVFYGQARHLSSEEIKADAELARLDPSTSLRQTRERAGPTHATINTSMKNWRCWFSSFPFPSGLMASR